HAASPELSTLRTSMLPGIAEAAAKNKGRALALYEVGRVFAPESERRSLGMLVAGEVYPKHWSGEKSVHHDFYSLKGVIEEFAETLRRSIGWAPSKDGRFHPGRRASVVLAGCPIGVMGELSP